MEWWQILLYSISIIIVVYVFGMFYALECLITFRTKIKKKTLAISLLLSEKRDVLLSLMTLLENDIHDESIKESATKVRWLKMNNVSSKDIEAYLFLLSSLQKRLVLFANNGEYKNDENFVAYFEILSDLDANYRKIAATFNSQVVGYEYWRKTPLFKGLFFVFGFREIKRLP